MEIGAFIKLHRIKQNMTQEDLAKGIVSMSYLSKIENGRTDASSEVIGLLCTRLGVEMDNETDITIRDKCQKWFASLYERNDKQEMIDGYHELRHILSSTKSDCLTLFEIHKIRYFLLLGKYDQALEQINYLNEISGTFDNLQQFYWYKFKGNYRTVKSEFDQAMRMYKLAEEKFNHIHLPETELADIQYTISVTHSKLRNTLEAIEYASKAIDVFQKEYNFIRCAQCHNILGISYRRIKMYDKAIKHYNLAKHLGELNKNNQIIQLTNQNLGYLYAVKGETKEAIKYFTEVIDNEDVNLGERLSAITALVKEYYKIQDYEQAKQMLEKAQKLLTSAKNDVFYKLYYYTTQTYMYAIHEQYDQFTSLVTEEFIPYLKKQRDYANLIDYSTMLARHFEKMGRYKDSVKYYKLANITYEEVVNL